MMGKSRWQIPYDRLIFYPRHLLFKSVCSHCIQRQALENMQNDDIQTHSLRTVTVIGLKCNVLRGMNSMK